MVEEPLEVLGHRWVVGGHASCRDNGWKWLVLQGADAKNLVGDALGDQVQICWLEGYWRFEDGGVE
jgi:hypothetical protein